MKYFILIIALSACCKPVATTVEDYCNQSYDLHSSPYINPYKGTLVTNTSVMPTFVYLEKYGYHYPRANPNNPYEIIYLRRDNTVFFNGYELYKYNFCTNKVTLVAKNVLGWPDWSVKDWIIFSGMNRELWKVKSNGDSLIQLTHFGPEQYAAFWNPSGEKFFWNYKYIANENATHVDTIPHCGTFVGWFDDENIINGSISSRDLYRTNIITSNKVLFYTLAENTGTIHVNTKLNEFLCIEDSSSSLVEDQFYRNSIQNYTNGQIIDLDSTFKYLSFQNALYDWLNNKLLCEITLRDTFTGTPTRINTRTHIAIMNRDGSNIRQVLLPE